jgi:hypothetical protein
MVFHFPHCALIHRSAWKVNSPKSVCGILHSPDHLVADAPFSPGLTH